MGFGGLFVSRIFALDSVNILESLGLDSAMS